MDAKLLSNLFLRHADSDTLAFYVVGHLITSIPNSYLFHSFNYNSILFVVNKFLLDNLTRVC